MKWDQLSARSRRWLSVGGVSAGVLLCSWMVASGFSGSAGKATREKINESILTDADTQQTTIDRLAAQLDSSRSENADLARKLDELSERQQRLPDTVANQLRRSLDREAATQDRELAGRLQQLEVQLERLQQQAKTAEDERRRKSTEPSTVMDRPDKPKRDAEAGNESVVATTPGIEFPDADRPSTLDEPASIFQDEAPSALAGEQPGGAAAVDGEDTAQNGQALAIRFVSKRDADAAVEGNADIPSTGENLFKLPATSILTGTLITGLDAPTGAQAQGEPLPVLLRLKKEV